MQYEPYGSLTIDKSGAETTIESEGALKLLSRWRPPIHLSFDQMYPLASRQVLGLYNDEQNTLVPSTITVRGKECRDSIPNYGSFDREFPCYGDACAF